MAASDYFLVPVSAEYLPMKGLALLANSVEQIWEISPGLRSLGLVLTRYIHTERICRQTENMLREEYGTAIFQTRIRGNTKAKSCPAVRQTIFQFEDSETGRGTEDYTRLTQEVLERLENLQAGKDEIPTSSVVNG